MSQTSRSRMISAALRIRSSAPSGSTMCLRCCFALLTSSYWNMSGVTRPEGAIAARSSSPGRSTLASMMPRAAAIFRLFSAISVGRTLLTFMAVVKVSVATPSTGIGEELSPSSILCICRRRFKVSRQYHAGNTGIAARAVCSEGAENDIGPVTGRDHETPLFKMIEKVRQFHGGDLNVPDFAVQPRIISADQLGPEAAADIADGGSIQEGVFGKHIHRRVTRKSLLHLCKQCLHAGQARPD